MTREFINIKSIVGVVLTIFVIHSCNTKSIDSKTSSLTRLPNIVLIISDDQAWTDYSFMGHPHIQTPHIDKLAKESLTFTHGYVPTSLCAPSLASMITGLYPRHHLVLGNDRVLPQDKLKNKRTPGTSVYEAWRGDNYKSVIQNFRTLNTLPKLLKEKGYLSFQTGKWWIGDYANGGFDYGMTHGDRERGGRHGDYGLEIGRKGMDTLYNYIDIALEKEQPFFMWYAPFLPHTPHNPPDSLLKKYLPNAPTPYIAKYWAMCEWFDTTCGQLMNYLDDRGQTENTLFVYVCDNGWVQNENNAQYNKISKRSPYDYGLRTPIMYKWKGKIIPKIESDLISSSIDIIPTILNMLNIDQPNNLEGINVLDESKLQNRKAVLGEIYAHDFNTIEESMYYKMAITNPYKLILPDEKNKPNEEVQLFDIFNDPFETENLANSNPEIVQELKEIIDHSWEGH